MATRLQRYWDILRQAAANVSPAGFYKYSQEGSSANYEQALANIARAYVHDSAPSLAQYEIGFQLVEKSDDNLRAKGIFGYKIGNNLIYIPIFYIDGKVYGYDMMYLYKDKLFLPVIEGFVSQLVKNQALDIGSPVDTIDLHNKLALPNLMQLKPTTLKWAMDQPNWLRPFLPDYIALYHYPRIQWTCNPFDLVKMSSDCTRALGDFLFTHPRWIPRMREIYGQDFDAFLLKFAQERGEKKPVVPTLERSKEPADVELVVYVHEKSPTRLSPTELSKLREQGYLVRDKRKHTSVVRLKPNLTFEGLRNVTRGGFYHLLLKDLTIVCAYVVPIYSYSASEEGSLKHGNPIRDKQKQYLVIPIYRADEKGQVLRRFKGEFGFVAKDRNVVSVAHPADKVDHNFNAFRNAREVNPSENDRVSFFTEELATPPTSIREVSSKSHRGRTVITGVDVTVTLDPAERSLKPRLPYRWLRRTDDTDSVAYGAEYHFVAPSRDTKYVKVVQEFYAFNDKPGEEEKEVRNICYSLARVDDLLNEATKAADYSLQVYQKGKEYVINKEAYDFYRAFELLLKKHNMSEKDAVEILKTADSRHKVWLVKQAQAMPYDQMPTPPSVPPMPPEPARGTFGGYNFQSPTLQVQGVPMPDKPATRDSARLPTPWFDQLLEKALQSGQKEVLDVSVLSNLLNITSDKDVVENNLHTALQGLSAIGAMRFGIYANWDVFKQRYGEEDLERKEKALRAIFKEVGKVLYELQQRPAGFDEAMDVALMESKA